MITLFLCNISFTSNFNSFCRSYSSNFYLQMGITDYVRQMVLRAFYLWLISFISNWFKSLKSVMKLAIRFSKALFCLLYVFLVLVGLLVSGFATSVIIMRILVEKPIRVTGNLNFDYTKTSPAAVLPIAATSSGVPSKDKMTPTDNQKLQLTVSLTLPESDHNRNLGVFQVRVESLSAKGDVIISSSYPTMLRYKSQPIRVIESLLKSVALVAGLQSEVQNLKIVMREFGERHELTSCFKVILEQRAEFQAGSSGLPEIYAASVAVESGLPLVKRLVWNWRRTMFVWIGFTSFLAEMIVVLLLCSRSMIIPRRRSMVVHGHKKSS